MVSNLQYDYLSEQGKQELKVMLALLVQHQCLQRVQFLGHLATLMLIYMPPCEVYSVLAALIQSSEREKSDKKALI